MNRRGALQSGAAWQNHEQHRRTPLQNTSQQNSRPRCGDCKASQRFWNGRESEFGHSLSFNSLSFNCHATPPTKALKSSETGSSADRCEGGLLDRDLDIRVGLAGDRTGLSAGDVERRIAAILWKLQWRQEAVKQRTAWQISQTSPQ